MKNKGGLILGSLVALGIVGVVVAQSSTSSPRPTINPTSGSNAIRTIPPVQSPPPSPPPPPKNCNPNYRECVPNASDVDCAGGSGNGPAYVNGPIHVIGKDVYGLDRDGNGIGCE